MNLSRGNGDKSEQDSDFHRYDGNVEQPVHTKADQKLNTAKPHGLLEWSVQFQQHSEQK